MVTIRNVKGFASIPYSMSKKRKLYILYVYVYVDHFYKLEKRLTLSLVLFVSFSVSIGVVRREDFRKAKQMSLLSRALQLSFNFFSKILLLRF